MGEIFDFSRALAEIKKGNRVTRKQWKSDETFVMLCGEVIDGVLSKPSICLVVSSAGSSSSSVSWNPNHESLLAEDWKLV